MESSKLSNKHLKCWVPVCSTVTSDTSVLLSLPKNTKTRELWLALAGKPKGTSSFDEIIFCGEHFLSSDIMDYKKGLTLTNSLPLVKMPEKICRTCMKIIPTNEMFYVISNSTATNMPSCLQDTMMYYTSDTSLLLSHILKQTLPEMNIKFDPPPLICDGCYQCIWLYYMFSMTCIDVEKTLKDNISLESYSRMVLCRSCPRMQGTVFISVDESSSMGCVLKNIFSQNDNVKESLPLRLCIDCHNILKKLDQFRNNCLLVEEKLNRHYALEQEIAERKKNLSIKLKISSSNDQYVPYLLEIPQMSEVDNKFERSPKTRSSSLVNPILTDQWKKEELAQAFIKYKSTLKDGTNEKATHDIYIMIHKKLQKVGITCKLQDVVSAWKELQKNATMKFQQKLPLEFLDKLILEFNDEQLKKQTNVAASTSNSSNGAIVKTAKSDKIENKNLNNSKIRVLHLEIISAFEKEYDIFYNDRKSKGENQKLSFKNILQKVYDKNKQFQNKPFPFLYNKFQYARSILINEKHKKARIFSDISKKENLYQRKKIHQSAANSLKTSKNSSSKMSTSSHKKKVKQNGKRPKRHHLSLSDKLAFVEEVKKEYNNLVTQDKSKLHLPRPWRYVINQLADRGFLNYDFNNLYSLWSRLKTSACVHEKDGRDIVDIEIWKLLELHKKVKILTTSNLKTCDDNSSDGDIPTSDQIQETSKVQCGKSNDNIPSDCVNELNANIEIQAPIEFQDKNKTDDDVNAKSTNCKIIKSERRNWTEDDKLKALKLIKNEYNFLAQKNTSHKRISWAMVIKSIVDKGTSDFREQDLVYMWSQLKSKVYIHEKTEQMSVLDWKVWRLLRKAKGINILEDHPSLAAEKKIQDIPQPKRMTDEQRIDLISFIREYGSCIFQTYEAPNENPIWNKICEKMKQKGYNIPKFRIKNSWRGMKKSATLAMADQKPPSKFDKLIMDFMKNIASVNSDVSSSTNNDVLNNTSADQLCNKESTKSAGTMSNENSNESDSCHLVYDYVSKQDVEAVVDKLANFEHINVKSEVSELSFKKETNMLDADEVIDLCDDDSDDIFQENSQDTKIKSEM